MRIAPEQACKNVTPPAAPASALHWRLYLRRKLAGGHGGNGYLLTLSVRY